MIPSSSPFDVDEAPPHPVAVHPTLRGSGVRRTDTAQGQDVVVVLDGRAGGNAVGSPLCQLGITMRPGKVSTPHVHETVHVYVRLEECGPQGVLTLWGTNLQHEVWLHAAGSLWIPPGEPHVAVYPRYDDLTTHDAAAFEVPALAVETRTTSDPFEDVVPLPHLWGPLVERLATRSLLNHVDLPDLARTAWDDLTGNPDR